MRAHPVVRLSVIFVVVTLAAAQSKPVRGQGFGTAFTYQGQLLRPDGTPRSQPCDFEFRLFDSQSGGTQRGAPITASAVQVDHGVFTRELDFGAQFDGNPRFLEVKVACPPDPQATLPRQKIAPTPYALFAANALTYSAGQGISLSGNQVSLNTSFTDSRYAQVSTANDFSGSENTFINNVAIGATSASGTDKLRVVGNVRISTGDVRIECDQKYFFAGSGSAGEFITQPCNDPFFPIEFWGGGPSQVRMRIYNTGDVQISNLASGQDMYLCAHPNGILYTCGPTSPIATTPHSSELQTLRAQLDMLQRENARLRTTVQEVAEDFALLKATLGPVLRAAETIDQEHRGNGRMIVRDAVARDHGLNQQQTDSAAPYTGGARQ